MLFEDLGAQAGDAADDEQEPADRRRESQVDEDGGERAVDVQRDRFDAIANRVLERSREVPRGLETLARAMREEGGIQIVDSPPGDERLVQSAINAADAVVIPTRAGGVEYSRVAVTLGMIPSRTPRGLVVCAARLGTNDLDETIAWWKAEKVPVWGVVPERVGIAAGPEARLYREGLEEYDKVLRRALRGR